jgi:hypothetical protein
MAGAGVRAAAAGAGSGRIRFLHYSIRTEQAYLDWIKRFIRHFGKRHPRDMGAAEVSEFLTHLAVAGRVAASTQNQAKSALLFLYREVLEVELPWLDDVESAKAPKRRLPVVLNGVEVMPHWRGSRARIRWSPACSMAPAAHHGMPALAGEGRGVRARRDPGAGRQGRQGSGDDAAGQPDAAFARAP